MTDKTTFSNLGLSSAILEVLETIGYKTPTPIQEKIIPFILGGHDVLGCAQTGTGKTASYTLPMIDFLSKGRARARMPRSLVLIPTRELAMQVQKNFETYSQKTNLKQALLIGGSGVSAQEKMLDKGVDVLIATPGRLLDLHERGKIMLHDIKILVLDEADRMLDMGFMPDIEKLMKVLPKKRQTLMFSATMPKEIRKLAQNLLSNYKEVTISSPTKTAETISQFACHVTDNKDKTERLKAVLKDTAEGHVIVFVNTKKEATSLSTSLKRGQLSIGVLHGDLSQGERTETLQSFSKGDIKILIASDVAARGLDIETISHVINFDVPNNRDDYIHRIGRTGRAGQTGISITFVADRDADNWQKVVGKSNDKILDLDTKEPFKTTPPQKTKKPSPKMKDLSKEKRPAQEKRPTKENQPAKTFTGFGDFTPDFMSIPLGLSDKKSKEEFSGVHEKR